MVPPAADEPLAWAVFAVSVAVILCSTVFYRRIDAIERWLGLPDLWWNERRQRIIGVVAGTLGIVIGILFLAFA